MKRIAKSSRALLVLVMLAGCNAILGIEERDLVEGASGDGQGGEAATSGKSGEAGGEAAGGMTGAAGTTTSGGTQAGGSEAGGAGGSPDEPNGGTASGAGGASGSGGFGPGGSSSGAGGSGGGTAGTSGGGGAGTAGQAGTGGTAPVNPCGTNIVAESSGAQHTHTLTVPAADIAAGVTKTYATSITSGHNHFVSVTAANFTALKAGMEVKRKSCSGGDHQFVLKCGGGGSTPVPPTAQECPDDCGGTDLTACP